MVASSWMRNIGTILKNLLIFISTWLYLKYNAINITQENTQLHE